MLDELKRSVRMAKNRVPDKFLRKWLPHEPDYFLAKHGDRLIAAVELAEAGLAVDAMEFDDSNAYTGDATEGLLIYQRYDRALKAYRATEESHES